MIKSMTGYGRAEARWAGGMATAELRSVNHRFCEIVVRVPRSLSALEDDLKRLIQQRCARGRIEAVISLGGGKEAGKTLSLDRDLARQYHGLLRELQKVLHVRGAIDVALVAGFRDIISVTEQPADERRLTQAVKRAVTAAVTALDHMRRREGATLVADVTERLRVVGDELSGVAGRAPFVTRDYFDRLRARVEKLSGLPELDEGRLQQELAMFADRCDITEELTRLTSHLKQFEQALAGKEPVGRTLDFLLQEIGREVNTVGSKANDAEIATRVVRLKSELEKIREQVQNIE